MVKRAARKKVEPAPSAHDWMKNPNPKETKDHKAIRWHHGLAQITGGLSLRITKKMFSRNEVYDWIEKLRLTANEMEEMLNATGSASNNATADRDGGDNRSNVQKSDENDTGRVVKTRTRKVTTAKRKK